MNQILRMTNVILLFASIVFVHGSLRGIHLRVGPWLSMDLEAGRGGWNHPWSLMVESLHPKLLVVVQLLLVEQLHLHVHIEQGLGRAVDVLWFWERGWHRCKTRVDLLL